MGQCRSYHQLGHMGLRYWLRGLVKIHDHRNHRVMKNILQRKVVQGNKGVGILVLSYTESMDGMSN